ncbi:alpha-ketoacid dehydrogenase subunit alpha/beta [Reichenbachiella versicolor]|uniref:alpha-ketoacid dehydrogenase subunit alpha/beta n=1 Tax=Reichenbachiella versicolor TaxID=1821036 RepID=UPI000D6E74B3|nr:dehydrogenase E1 component subunit alpha/beta [Reichenbachiella versicolor]
MHFDRKDLTDQQLIDLYEALLVPRLIEEKMLINLRQGKISKWFSGYGQEAISVGAAKAMAKNEYILPMHRNLGMFTARGIPLDKLFAQFQGKSQGFTQGRDRSFHFGSKEHRIVGMISHLGAQLGVADGIALSKKLKQQPRATLVVSGDGGASEGDFHEALNLAAVWELPVIFLIENNQWGLSTPSEEQFKCKSFTDKGIGYGIQAEQVNGNNILDVFNKVSEIVSTIRKRSQPYILECKTFRIRGHEEASGTKYYPEGLVEKWQKEDPVENYEKFILDSELLSLDQVEALKTKTLNSIEEGLSIANSYPRPSPNFGKETEQVFAKRAASFLPTSTETTELRFVDAISDGLSEALVKYPNLIIMGQDIAEYGGVFKVTEGFVDDYGKDRIRNTPICESAVLGASLGLSIDNMKSVVEMQFADFVSCGFNQIVNNLGTSHYRWGQNADVVVRLPCGGGVGAGPFHSQSPESWFFHVPGLKIVYPSNPRDAKGLLLAAIDDPNPVLFFEHKALYRSISGDVPDGYYSLAIGHANIIEKGEDISVITYGMGVHWAKEASELFDDIDIEIVDLVTIKPWDWKTVRKSIKKTGKVIILHEANKTGGIGGEIASWVGEHLFEYLDAPVMRVGGLDTPIPFAKELEEQWLPKERFKKKIQELHNY